MGFNLRGLSETHQKSWHYGSQWLNEQGKLNRAPILARKRSLLGMVYLIKSQSDPMWRQNIFIIDNYCIHLQARRIIDTDYLLNT